MNHECIWGERATAEINSIPSRMGENETNSESRGEGSRRVLGVRNTGSLKDTVRTPDFTEWASCHWQDLSREGSDMTHPKRLPVAVLMRIELRGQGRSRETNCGVIVTIHRRDDDGSDQLQMMRR